MSDAPPPTPEPQDSRSAKADAKAEKARQKAMRPWYKKKRFVIPGVLLLLIIIASVAGGGGDTDTDPVASDDGTGSDTEQTDTEDPADTSDEADDEEPTTTGIGQPARDGQFEFTVSSFECGEDSVGEDPFTEDAQGQFCLMDVTVENIGDEAQFLFADNQYLYDSEDREFSASSEATFAFQPDGDGFFTEINPGNSIEGTIVFDVPADADILRAELHDSPFSGGVAVNLS